MDCGEIALLMIFAAAGSWACYRAFEQAGNARDIAQTIAWTLVVILSAAIGSFSLILLLIGSV